MSGVVLRNVPLIRAEIERAGQALKEGNDGMARVCCRRAAGEAIAMLQLTQPQRLYGGNAMIRLERLSLDPATPPEVRSAAESLRSKRNEEGGRKIASDPLRDLECILNYIEAELQGT